MKFKYIMFSSTDGEGQPRLTPVIFPDWFDQVEVCKMMRTQEADGTTSFVVDSMGSVEFPRALCSGDLSNANRDGELMEFTSV